MVSSATYTISNAKQLLSLVYYHLAYGTTLLCDVDTLCRMLHSATTEVVILGGSINIIACNILNTRCQIIGYIQDLPTLIYEFFYLFRLWLYYQYFVKVLHFYFF